ncbi:hypothetical protein ACFL38_03345 [Candidatus Omnitrophota bacterium]
MKKERSAGVLAFGIVCIVLGCIGLLGVLFTINQVQLNPPGFAMSFVFTVMLLVSGCGIVRVQSWARKLILWYAAVTLITALTYSPWAVKKVAPLTTEKLAELGLPISSEAIGMFLMIVNLVPTLIFAGIVFYFFTRPGVKAQFK